jgi:ABC-2 type transport system permease protein
VNGDRLLFLLKHEFRLWHRSAHSIRAMWPYYQVIWSVFLGVLLGGLIGAALSHLQLPNLNFAEDSPPDNVLWYAGGMIYWLLFLGFVGILFARRRIKLEQQTRNWLLSSPLSSQLSFANAVLHPILTGSVGSNFVLLIYSVPLLIIYRSPRLALGIHLTATAWTMLAGSLEFWGLYISFKWGNHWFWKLLKQAFCFSALGLVIFIFGLLLGIGDRVLSLERVIQILTEQARPGNLLGSDSWIWFPVRAVFLDPLSILTWIVTGIGLMGLTIQVLHRSLFNDLQAIINPPTPIAAVPKKPKQFQGHSLQLFVLRDWKFLINKIPSVSGILPFILLLISYWMCMIPSGTSQIDSAVALALGSVLIPAFNTSILTHYCIAEDPMQDVLRSSPISFAQAKAYKRLAGLLPIWVSILPILIGLSIFSKPWVLVAVLALAATTSHAYLRDWNACPVKPTEVFSMDSDLDALGCRDGALICIEAFSFLLWLIIAIFFLTNLIAVGMFFLSLEGYILFCAYRRNRQLGDSWSI